MFGDARRKGVSCSFGHEDWLHRRNLCLDVEHGGEILAQDEQEHVKPSFGSWADFASSC